MTGARRLRFTLCAGADRQKVAAKFATTFKEYLAKAGHTQHGKVPVWRIGWTNLQDIEPSGVVRAMPAEIYPRNASQAGVEDMTMKVRRFRAGEVLFLTGTLAEEAFLIRKGKVEVYDVVGGVETVFATRDTGDIVGEIALLDGQRRSASLRGVTDGELIIITAPMLHDEMRKASPMVRKLMESYLSNIRRNNAAAAAQTAATAAADGA